MTGDKESIPDEDGFEDEFSLERLSEAYAEVIRQQSGDKDSQSDGQRGQLVAEKIRNESELSEEPEQDTDKHSPPDDDTACPVSPESIVESILFVGCPRGEKLTAKEIAGVIRDVSPAEVKKIGKALNEKYIRENRAWRIVIDGNELRMKLADDLENLQIVFHGRDREASLSQSAIDVLALVAYRQPVTREQIEESRDKSSAGVVRQLVKRNLIVEEPPAKKGTKGTLYRTTDRFLELMGLDSIDDLPQSQPVELDDF